MRLFNHRFVDDETLQTFLDERIMPVKGEIFVQVFSGILDPGAIQHILDSLAAVLPNARIIGTTTAGEIMDGTMISSQIVLSFSIFDDTTVKTYHFSKTDFENGVRAAQSVISERTKLCIVFAEGLKNDSESFLNGFSSVCNDVIIAGGNAGDDLSFSNTYIFENNRIYDDGVVIAALDSDVLQVNNAYSLNWTPIGKSMKVTRADKNVVYEIDGLPVKEIYRRYLGNDILHQITQKAFEFPLLKIVDSVQIARAIVGETEEGGLIYEGHIHVGEYVRFAIGNVEEIHNRANEIQRYVNSVPAEATYIYSCSVRKLFMKEQLNYELGLINEIAPTAGFFTFGEFYHSSSCNLLLNITTTTITLSETPKKKSVEVSASMKHSYTMLNSLSNLVNVTQKELNETIRLLDQYKMVLDESAIVSKTNTAGIITYVNDAFCSLSGYSREELIGKTHQLVRHPDNKSEMFEDFWKLLKAGKVWKNTFKNRNKKGDDYYIKSVVAPIFNDEGTVVEYISASVDVSELIVKDQIIQRQLIDPLTMTANRVAFFNDIADHQGKVLLTLINIDRFSYINNYFGYGVGDRVLQDFARLLVKSFSGTTIYRISSDEFALVCSATELNRQVRQMILDQIGEMENHKFIIDDYVLSLTLTGGVAYASGSEVYNLAHIALKEAQEQRSKVIFFNENRELSEKTRNNLLMANTIKSAIEEDRIVPYFQGIVDIETRRIVKYEALMRLINPDGSVITPFWFLEHAKRSKLYDRLSRIMIEKTFEYFQTNNYVFSINLTLQDILCETTRQLLLANIEGLQEPGRLIVEIVESEGIEQFDEVRDFLTLIKRFGCKVAIDDFGSGYSNFNYLSELDVDFIKIDGSLVQKITEDKNHLLTLESILFFARRKGIQTIAEYVETEETFALLATLGVNFAQGFLFSIPSPELK